MCHKDFTLFCSSCIELSSFIVVSNHYEIVNLYYLNIMSLKTVSGYKHALCLSVAQSIPLPPSSQLFCTFFFHASLFPSFLPLSLEHRMTLCFLNRSHLLLPLALPSRMTPPLCCSLLPAMFYSASLLMSHLIPPA